MTWNAAEDADARRDDCLIGIFRSDDEAGGALVALRQRGFDVQRVAARYSEDETRRQSSTSSGTWFGELREIFHEDAKATAPWSEENLKGVLADIGVQSDDAERIARHVGPQASLIALKAAENWREAKLIVEDNGGRVESISSAGVRPSDVIQSTATTDSNTTAAHFSAPATTEDLSAAGPEDIQLYGEELRVHKEKVGSGDVRVHKETVTEMHTVQVPVTREQLVVEHTDSSSAYREREIVVPLSEERVHVDKDVHLLEQYRVGKHEVTRKEPITESLRRERLLIDNEPETTRE